MPKTKKQQAARLREVVQHSWFQFLTIRTKSGTFPLKTDQRNELTKWASDGDSYDKDWWKPTKLVFINNDGKEMPVLLHEAVWQDDEEIRANKWRELCTAGHFEHVKVNVGDDTFPLRSHQEQELVKWAGGKKFDKEWLHITAPGIPTYFEGQDGSENTLLLGVDAWLDGATKAQDEAEGKGAKEANTAPPPSKKAKKCTAGELGKGFQIGERKGVLREWASEWFCYWDGSFGMPKDPAKDFVFAPALEMTQTGIVRTKDWDVLQHNSERDMQETAAMLLEIDESASHGREIGLGDESDYPWLPFILPWGPDEGALCEDTLLSRLGAHEQLRAKQAMFTLKLDQDEDNEGGGNIGVWLEKFPGQESLYFQTGGGLLNPLVVFAVVRVKPHLVAGFMGGIVHT